jgi:hypothetical protein
LGHPDQKHPCQQIVRWQGENGILADKHQLPEPWSGRLESAPLLFVSSNPSISKNEVYPTREWSDAQLVEFFQDRFGRWVEGGSRFLQKDGSYGRPTRFNQTVKKYAEAILAREVIPGEDYALTEVVHCKTPNEYGVGSAKKRCAELYLRPLLQLSAAKCVVVLGSPAARVFDDELKIERKNELVRGPVDVGARMRIIVYLPHTNFFGPRGPAILGDDCLHRIRSWLNTDVAGAGMNGTSLAGE